MIITEKKNPSKKYFVYVVYWGNYRGINQRLHYIIDLDENDGSFIPLSEDEVDVFDNSIDRYYIIKGDSGTDDVFVHQSVLPLEGLCYELVNGGYREGVEQLYKNMRKMGLDPEPK